MLLLYIQQQNEKNIAEKTATAQILPVVYTPPGCLLTWNCQGLWTRLEKLGNCHGIIKKQGRVMETDGQQSVQPVMETIFIFDQSL